MLGLITCFFNPTNSKRLKENYFKFRKELHHPIVTVELAFNDQPFLIDDAIKIRGSEKNIMWQKERLLNIALESLPGQIDKVAWLDADIIFENPNWFEETEKNLDTYQIVQPFEFAYEIGTSSDPVNQGISFGKFLETQPNLTNWEKPWPRIGIAWAARRQALTNGFFDKHILGTNDAFQFIAWLGLWNHPHLKRLNPYMKKDFLNWGWTTAETVSRNIGYVSGNVRHLPHGSKINRQYSQRDSILIKYEFKPEIDIMINSDGLFEWNSDKSELHRAVKQYFENRKDDEF